jgi:3-oxoacyl-[acyl-carrier protein] reductase
MTLAGKTAIVTGAGRGIGAAIAKKLASYGANVVLADLKVECCQEIVEGIGPNALAVACDVTDRAAVHAMIEKTVEVFGQIDILVNNAGITADSTLKKMTDEAWDRVLTVNLKSAFICTQEVASHMMANKWGRIISMSSLAGVAGNFGQSNYAASKAGIIGLTKTWSKELGKYQITANAIAPGLIDTEMTQKIPDEVKQQLIDQIPARRMGKTDEIAMAVVYLASEEAGFINGVTLNINGGAYTV